MFRLVFALLIVSAPAFGAKYKCKDAAGNWTEDACTGAAAPPAPTAAAQSREDNPERQKMVVFCADKWPADFRMQDYCLEQQAGAAARLAGQLKSDVPDELKIAGGNCAMKWTKADDVRDWTMIEYCWNQQKEAFHKLRGR